MYNYKRRDKGDMQKKIGNLDTEKIQLNPYNKGLVALLKYQNFDTIVV